jgi:hypothetical protein
MAPLNAPHHFLHMKLAEICNRLCMVLMLLILGIHLGSQPYGELSNDLYRYQARLKKLPAANLATLVDRKKVQALTPAQFSAHDSQAKIYVTELKALENLVSHTDAELSHHLHTQSQLTYLLTLSAMGLCLGSLAFAIVQSKKKTAAAPVTP